MAEGDVTVFTSVKKAIINKEHDLDNDSIKVAICNNTVVPTENTSTPTITTFTEVGSAGTYVAGGTVLTMVVTDEGGGVIKVDATNHPSWNSDPSNDTDAYWGIIYNDSHPSKAAIAFVDLGGPKDMTAGTLTIDWNTNGIFLIT